MGFDPRQRTPHRVTSNVEALLRENDALRREIQHLQRELERARRSQWQQPSAQAPARGSVQRRFRPGVMPWHCSRDGVSYVRVLLNS